MSRKWLAHVFRSCGFVVLLALFGCNPHHSIDDVDDVESPLIVLETAYQMELGRLPDASGREAYLPLLLAGERDGTWLRRVLRDSPEGNLYRVSQRGRLHRSILMMLNMGAFWGGCFILCWGLGYWVVTFCLSASAIKTIDGFRLFWIGLGSLFGLLYVWALFFPLTWVPGLLLMVPALAAVSMRVMGKRVTGPVPCGAHYWRWLLFAGLACMLFVLTVAASAQREIVGYDTFLYHLNAVRWANTFRAVPGLANLHIRLGTNSAWLLFAAMLNHGPLFGRLAWYLPGFAALSFSLYLVQVLLLRRDVTTRIRFMAGCLLIYALGEILALGPHLYFDAPAQYLLLVACLELLCMVDRIKVPNGGVEPEPFLLCVGIPAVASFVVKPIGAPFLLFFGAIGFFGAIYLRRSLSGHGRRLVGSALVMACILFGWGARNIVQSGWLFFPASIGRFGGDWCVPHEPVASGYRHVIQSVAGQRLIIQAWARSPGAHSLDMLGSSLQEWFPVWFENNHAAVEVRWLFPIGCIGFLAALAVLKLTSNTIALEGAILFVCASLLLFWFFQAPDLRFGRGIVWLWFAAGVAAFFHVMHKAVQLLGVAMLLLWSGASFGATAWKVVGTSPWVVGKAPSARMVTEIVNNQEPPLEVFVPVSGDQAGDSPIPSTPYPSSCLRARSPGNLQAGFLIER